MLFRPTQKLATKIKLGKRIEKPLEQNAFVDWSANLFTAIRKQYILLSNTQSLYSCVLPGVGIASESRFVDAAIVTIEEFMREDDLGEVFEKFILGQRIQANFAKALDRSVTGSMNDLIVAAKYHLGCNLNVCEVGHWLNKTPLSILRDQEGRKYNNPNQAMELIVNLASR